MECELLSSRRSTMSAIIYGSHRCTVKLALEHSVTQFVQRSFAKIQRVFLEFQQLSGQVEHFLKQLSLGANLVEKFAMTKISTLSNGIRVVTENVSGYFGGLGVYIHAGSRYEPSHLRGLAHFNEKLAYKVRFIEHANPRRTLKIEVASSCPTRLRNWVAISQLV